MSRRIRWKNDFKSSKWNHCWRRKYWLVSKFIPVFLPTKISIKKTLKPTIDLASILARMKNNDGTYTYSIPEMTAHLHTFIFAGFDTTASTLHWILFYVGKFPAYAKRVANELEENGGRINSKTLKNVPFTTSFIKEVLRLTHIVDCIGNGFLILLTEKLTDQ